jgi:hypothetical protein
MKASHSILFLGVLTLSKCEWYQCAWLLLAV